MAVDQYFLGNNGMAERFGSAESLAFRKDVSQAAFLLVEAGLGTVFPEEGRHLSLLHALRSRCRLEGKL